MRADSFQAIIMKRRPIQSTTNGVAGRARPDAARRRRRAVDPVVGALVACSGLVAAFADCSPTGFGPADRTWCALLAAGVAYAATLARRWTWLVLAIGACIGAGSLGLLAGAEVGLAGAVYSIASERHRWLGAAVAGTCCNVLLRQGSDARFGASALLTLIAVAPLAASAYARSPSRVRRRANWTVAALSAVTVLASIGFSVALLLSRHDLTAGTDLLRDSKGLLGEADQAKQDTLRGHLTQGAAHFERAADRLDATWAQPARMVPVLGHYARAATHLAADGQAVARSAANLATVADFERLAPAGGIVPLAEIDRLRPAVLATSDAVERAVMRARQADTPWLAGPARRLMAEALDELGKIERPSRSAALAVKAAPALFGATETQRYFVGFSTPAEARGLGGFLGSYAEIEIDQGRIRLLRTGRVEELNELLRRNPKPLTEPVDYVNRFGRFQPDIYFQDVTLSPHFPSVAAVIRQLYPRAGGNDVDGVIVMDPYATAELLNFTGPISLSNGSKVDAANAADFLLRDQYVLFADDNARVDLLGELTAQIAGRILVTDFPSVRKLGEMFGPLVREHRMVLDHPAPQATELFSHLGASGALPDPDGDVLMVAHQNSAQNKIDVFMHRSIDYTAEWDADTGQVRSTATITLRNDAPASGLPSSVIGSNDQGLPLGTNRMYLSVYSTLNLTGADLGGVRVPLETNTEAGLHVYSTYVSIPHQSSIILKVFLEGSLPDPRETGRGYHLMIRPQATVNPDVIRASIRGDVALAAQHASGADLLLAEEGDQ